MITLEPPNAMARPANKSFSILHFRRGLAAVPNFGDELGLSMGTYDKPRILQFCYKGTLIIFLFALNVIEASLPHMTSAK